MLQESRAAVANDVYRGTKHNGASVSSLYLLENGKWKENLSVPVYFGTKASKFCLRIISFSSLESEFRFERLRNKLISIEHVRQPGFNNCEITAWSFESNVQYFNNGGGRPLCRRAACILGMES